METKYFMYRNEPFRVWKQNVSCMETKRFVSWNPIPSIGREHRRDSVGLSISCFARNWRTYLRRKYLTVNCFSKNQLYPIGIAFI